MASSVYYKFKAQKNESRITFDGTGITVFDLKKEIIQSNNFGKATDFDLLLFDSAEKEYKDDSQIIPRSSSVIAKRMPPAKPGKGRAAIYISGNAAALLPMGGRSDSKLPLPSSAPATGPSPTPWPRPGGPMSRRFDGKDEKVHVTTSSPKPPTDTSALAAPSTVSDADDEAARIKAMFQANAEHWEETQERMSHAVPIYSNPRASGSRRPFQPPQHHSNQHENKPIPPGYICHRCAKKGHWIQDCPTNDDREFDNRPRIKRTTGIPRSFLKSVEVSSEGAPQGVMVTPEGGFVVAEPDSAAWQKQHARSTGLTAAEVREKTPSDPTLACPICTKLFRDAVKTPCCSKTFCEECIQTHLLERDFVCPSCHSKIASLDKLVPDSAARGRVQKYVEEEIAESKQDAERSTPEAPSQAKESSEEPATNENNEELEYTFDAQPGNNVLPQLSNSTMFSTPPETEITQIQAQLAQLMLMMQSPQLAPPMRMQCQLQFQELSMRLNQLQMSTLYSGGMSMNHNGYMNNAGMAMPMMGNNGYGNVMGSNNGMGYGGGNLLFNNVNPLQNDSESAYQRLPVNNRRRGQKRDRPEDFLEVNGSKVPRYYE